VSDQQGQSTLAADAFRLDGKFAVVTGAAQGLGRAIAVAFAEYGADLAICDRKVEGMEETAATIRSLGRSVTTQELDVRSIEGVNEWIGSMGTINVLVNNAGGGFHAHFDTINDKGQRALVDENFTSVTSCIRASLDHFVDGGSIINVTTIEAYRGAPGFPIYGAMKAAVEHLSRTLALELSPRGIRVNTLAPDALHTPGDEQLLGDVGASHAYGEKLALGWGEIEDIAGPAVFLASAASRFVTGTTIHVDGGSDAARGWAKQPDGSWLP
jgi:NAD(P)-dependent dehydrogenase (short-subunit alcohol dehydrogenase family)